MLLQQQSLIANFAAKLFFNETKISSFFIRANPFAEQLLYRSQQLIIYLSKAQQRSLPG